MSKEKAQLKIVTCERLIWIAWIIWFVAALFYGYEFFVRISPVVMVNDLMSSFKTDAAGVGLLSASYYYAYALMQIPVGVLLDRFGIRYLLFLAAFAVAMGCLLFAIAHALALAVFARLLMGFGSSASFIACLKLAANWFKPGRFAFVVGLTNMLGVLGAIFGEAPLAHLVEVIGWHQVVWLSGLVGIILSVLIVLIVRDQPSKIIPQCKTKERVQHIGSGLLCIIKRPNTWLIALLGGLMVAPVSGFTELWSVPFLMEAHHVTRTVAAGIASLMFIGIAVGGPVNGFVSGLIQRRKPVIAFGNMIALIALVTILYARNLPISWLTVMLFLFGFGVSSMLLCFAMNVESNPEWANGVSIGLTNTLVMLGGTVFQPLIGWLLDVERFKHHATAFSLPVYETALVILPWCLIGAIALLLLIKETRCKQSEINVS